MSMRAESVLELRKVALGAPSEGLPGSQGQTDARLRGEVRRGMPQIFDLGIRALRDEFGWLVLVAALVWFPLRLIPLLIMADSPGETGEIVGGLLAAMNNGIAQTITTALLARRLADGYRARGALIPQPGRMLILCLPGIFGLGLVTGIATGIGMCMCLVPGIYLSFKLSLAPTVLVLEDASVGDAIRRSLYLTTTSFWRWAGLMLSIFIMAGPISGGVAILEQPFIREEVQEWAGLPAASFAWLYAGASSLFLAFAAALTSAVMTAYYLDLLERRDGVDLEQQLRELKTVEGAVR